VYLPHILQVVDIRNVFHVYKQSESPPFAVFTTFINFFIVQNFMFGGANNTKNNGTRPHPFENFMFGDMGFSAACSIKTIKQ